MSTTDLKRKELLSFILSYFVAQYVLIIIMCSFFVKIYFSFREISFLVRPLKYANFHCECYSSCVTSCNEYTRPPVFLTTLSSVVLSKLNPLSLLKLEKEYLFLVNIFVRHTFFMSKSSIKTKTVLTMTDMTKSTELLAFKVKKDGYEVTVKISLCIFVVLT